MPVSTGLHNDDKELKRLGFQNESQSVATLLPIFIYINGDITQKMTLLLLSTDAKSMNLDSHKSTDMCNS